MKPNLCRWVALAAAFAAASCSDQTGPAEEGPFVLNFEDRPDDGFVIVAPPVALAPGITLVDVLPTGDFYDFKTSEGWVLGPCNAAARSGDLLIGLFNNSTDITGVITFASAVSRVELYAGTTEGDVITVTAFDAFDQVVDIDATRSQCPMLGARDLLTVGASSNQITRIEISGGSAPAIDDLAYYRFP